MPKQDKTEIVRARIDPDLKKTAEKILKNLGLNSSDAIRIFYRQIVLAKGLPFEVKIPRQAVSNSELDEEFISNLSRIKDISESGKVNVKIFKNQ